MKVKIYIPCIDADGNKIELALDADLKAPILRTTDGVLDIAPISRTIRVDCMPDIRKEN